MHETVWVNSRPLRLDQSGTAMSWQERGDQNDIWGQVVMYQVISDETEIGNSN